MTRLTHIGPLASGSRRLLSCHFDNDTQFSGLKNLTRRAFLTASSLLWISGGTMLLEHVYVALKVVCGLREKWKIGLTI